MNKEKKQMIGEKKRNIGIIYRNRQLLKINIFILTIALALSMLGHKEIGDPLLWLGIIIFGYAMVTTFMAKQKLK